MQNVTKRIYISAGETSGDIHAAHVVRELFARDGALDVFGMGGPAMAAAGCEVVQHFGTLDLMGFAEVFRNLPRIRGVLRGLLSLIRRRRPDVAVLVDYPAFHMKLAGELKRLGVPVVTYIAPQVWAWRPGRARKLAGLTRKVLVILDFEEPIFREAGADVEFVGHPLLDEMDLDSPRGEARRTLGLDEDAPLVAILPGTRGHVIKKLLPVFMDAARVIRSARPDVAFAIGTRDGSPLPGDAARAHEITPPAGGAPPVESRALLRDATAALLVSGTATLEAALLGCPGIVGYRLGLFNWAIAKLVVRVRNVSLANIVLGESAYPELLQWKLTGQRAGEEIVRLLDDPAMRRAASRRLRKVRGKLGEPGASARVAEAVLKFVR